MDLTYLITPLLAWLVAMGLKFVFNVLKTKKLSTEFAGYGGIPSTHSAIVSSTAMIVALREGLDSAGFGLALTLAFIVIIDAYNLRRQIGRHAEAINHIGSNETPHLPLHERMGHSLLEIVSGIVVGVLVAGLVALSLKSFN